MASRLTSDYFDSNFNVPRSICNHKLPDKLSWYEFDLFTGRSSVGGRVDGGVDGDVKDDLFVGERDVGIVRSAEEERRLRFVRLSAKERRRRRRRRRAMQRPEGLEGPE